MYINIMSYSIVLLRHMYLCDDYYLVTIIIWDYKANMIINSKSFICKLANFCRRIISATEVILDSFMVKHKRVNKK